MSLASSRSSIDGVPVPASEATSIESNLKLAKHCGNQYRMKTEHRTTSNILATHNQQITYNENTHVQVGPVVYKIK